MIPDAQEHRGSFSLYTDCFHRLHDGPELSALSALAAAVAYKLHAAESAPRSIIRLIQLLLRNGTAPGVSKLELDGLTLKAQTGSGCLFASQLAAPDVIGPSVLYKAAAQGTENKGDVVFPALVVKSLDPFIMTGACSASRKKSLFIQTRIISPLLTLYWPLRFLLSG